MADVAILGATGPTGIHLANILRRQNMAVRVVSRGAANLQRAFGAPVFEKVAADVLDADAAIRAVDGCRLVYDCLGLPADQMHLHPAAAADYCEGRWGHWGSLYSGIELLGLSAAAALAAQRSASAVRRPGLGALAP